MLKSDEKRTRGAMEPTEGAPALSVQQRPESNYKLLRWYKEKKGEDASSREKSICLCLKTRVHGFLNGVHVAGTQHAGQKDMQKDEPAAFLEPRKPQKIYWQVSIFRDVFKSLRKCKDEC